MTTDKKLVVAAVELLDVGGEEAVTLRAVAQAVGVSHNAPYRHFKNRNALLTAVAINDFNDMDIAFKKIRSSTESPKEKLMAALQYLIDFSCKHPARYRLLFSDPKITSSGDDVKIAAMSTYVELTAIIQQCQKAGVLPNISHLTLTGLITATMHGLINLEETGRLHQEKGLDGVRHSLDMLIELLHPKR